jgi:hypothetical protein
LRGLGGGGGVYAGVVGVVVLGDRGGGGGVGLGAEPGPKVHWP